MPALAFSFASALCLTCARSHVFTSVGTYVCLRLGQVNYHDRQVKKLCGTMAEPKSLFLQEIKYYGTVAFATKKSTQIITQPCCPVYIYTSMANKGNSVRTVVIEHKEAERK